MTVIVVDYPGEREKKRKHSKFDKLGFQLGTHHRFFMSSCFPGMLQNSETGETGGGRKSGIEDADVELDVKERVFFSSAA